LIDVLNGNRLQKDMLTNLILQGHQLACCAITLSELFSGIRAVDVPKWKSSCGEPANGGMTMPGRA
jgi:hypothetical protein